MRAMRRVGTITGLFIMALLPIGAAGSAQPTTPTAVPVAITHPLGAIAALSGATPMLPESGLLLLVGTGLMGLATIVRRTTKV